MERARIIVRGEVQKVGFRSFVIELMDSLKLKGYADNLPDGTVEVLCEGENNRIEELIAKIKTIPPHFATIESVKPEWQEYIGDLKALERRGEDTPEKGATLDDLLKVMQSFDAKAEILNKRVGNMASNMETVASNTETIVSNTETTAATLESFRKESMEKQDQMLGKQDQLLGKQDQMLDKQDETTDVLRDIKSDTSGISTVLDEIINLKTKYTRIEYDVMKIKKLLKMI